jgi:hypothetical protein
VTLTLHGHRDGVLEFGPRAAIGGDHRPFALRMVQEIRLQDGLIASASTTFDRAELATDARGD